MRSRRLWWIPLALVGIAAGSVGAYVEGDGRGKAAADCLIGLEGYDRSDFSPFGKKGKQAVQCTDCDPACDVDGVPEPNGACTFPIAVRVNDPGVEGCTPGPLSRVNLEALTCRPATGSEVLETDSSYVFVVNAVPSGSVRSAAD